MNLLRDYKLKQLGIEVEVCKESNKIFKFLEKHLLNNDKYQSSKDESIYFFKCIKCIFFIKQTETKIFIRHDILYPRIMSLITTHKMKGEINYIIISMICEHYNLDKSLFKSVQLWDDVSADKIKNVDNYLVKI